MVSDLFEEKTHVRRLLIPGVLCALYIAFSAVLINFNKYMMHTDRFPFSMMLTTCHMTISWICALLFYSMAPSLFPSMSVAKENKLTILKFFCPLGLLCAIGIVLSNQAYLYCSVAFLQFMKQTNIATMFALSCFVGSQVCDRMKVFIIMWIMLGAAMAVGGEVNFILIGFFIQAGSQLGECSKNILQEYILSGSEIKLDPLTYQIFMCPVCLVVLSIGNWSTWDNAIIEQAKIWWPYLILSALCAFALNVTIANLIKQTSAMAFMLSGVVKDMLIVCVSNFMFGDVLAGQQIVGFTVATTGILLWSYYKVEPNAPVLVSFSHALGMAVKEDLASLEDFESQPLLKGKRVGRS